MSQTDFGRGGVARAILLGASGRPSVVAEAERLRPMLEKHVTIAASDFTGEQDLSRIDADVAVVLGGDGSIMRAARQMGNRQLPVIAVNLGKLGFLADVSLAELDAVLGDFRAGRLAIDEHLMFEASLIRAGAVVFRQTGLNDVVVHAGSPFTLLRVDLYVDAELVTTYSCDGVIVSTPVGSTAYCLSAGGPILRKTLQAFVVLPICPHTLTNRPVVDAADRVYELAVDNPNPGTTVVVDGRLVGPIEAGDRVRVVQAETRLKLVTAPGHTYYHTLREKLGWGGHLRLNERS